MRPDEEIPMATTIDRRRRSGALSMWMFRSPIPARDRP